MSENTINEIVRVWPGGSSRRRIAWQLGISRHQVEKVLAAHQRGRHEGTTADQLLRAKRRRARSLDPYEPPLAQLLKRYPDITAVRAHEELQQLGFRGSYNAVKRGWRELRPGSTPEPVRRFETGPGEQAQMDYSTYTIPFTQEGPRRVHLFSYVLGYSRSPLRRRRTSRPRLLRLRNRSLRLRLRRPSKRSARRRRNLPTLSSGATRRRLPAAGPTTETTSTKTGPVIRAKRKSRRRTPRSWAATPAFRCGSLSIPSA